MTQALPYTKQEAFIIPEILALVRHGLEVLVVPRSPARIIGHADARPIARMTAAQSLLSFEVLKGACAEFCRNPAASLKALRFLLGARNAKILLKNLAVYAKGLWLARLAREWRAAHIHAHWAATVSTMALIASEVSCVPWSFTAHRFDIVENNLLALKLSKAAFGRFISENGLEMARRVGGEAIKDKGRVIHMGVDLPALSIDIEQQPDTGTLLCPANLLPVKGHKYLIESIAILRRRGVRVSLWIAGEGELLPGLRKQVEEAGLSDQVHFLGHVPHGELLRFYEEGKVGTVVLPSIDLGAGQHEGIPVALIEAMSYGIPVVSTDTGGIPELLRGGAGLLVPAKDALALADAIERLGKDPELRDILARRGRKRAQEEFAIEQVTARLIAHFKQGGYSYAESHAMLRVEPWTPASQSQMENGPGSVLKF